MTLDWLDKFHRETKKPVDYTEKTLAAYAWGMKAKGAIVGVSVRPGPDCCAAAAGLSPAEVYQPAEAPRLPLPACSKGSGCGCVYRPVMAYQ